MGLGTSIKLERAERRKTKREAAALQRARIRKRDGHHCRCCHRYVWVGALLIENRAEVHHIVPRSLAPERIVDETNQVLLCGLCHELIRLHRIVTVGETADTVQFHRVKVSDTSRSDMESQ